MTGVDKNIIEAYADLFESLSTDNKLELLERLAKSLKKQTASKKEKDFYNSFGAFESDKSAEEIILEIKGSRRFKDRDITF